MKKSWSLKPILGSFLLANGLLLTSNLSQASGFALIEQSASGQGLSYAGAAANPEDISMMWFNPAGLTQFKDHQIVLAGHVIVPTAEFSNQDSQILGVGPLYGGDDNGAKTSFVPNVYWKGSYQGIDLGLGINVPFGSTVEYDDDWVGRYHAVKTSTKTVNINPAIAMKLNDSVSFGAGLNIQYIDVNLTQKVDFGLTSEPQQHDGYADLQADGIGYGVNLGFLYELDNQGYIGLSFRSQIAHSAEGDAEFTFPQTLPALTGSTEYANQSISADVTLPASASFSVLYPVGQKIKLLADVTWSGWSSFDELRIQFDNKSDSVQPEEWNDVFRYSAGMLYQYSPKWVFRTGLAYDETPIPNPTLRTPRIPDSDRLWWSAGAGYQWKQNLRFDIAYSHLWGGVEKIDAYDSDTGYHHLQGEFDTKVDIVSAQVVWNY